MDSKASKRYSDAPDYFEKASAAIEQMFRQTGPEIGPDGILKASSSATSSSPAR